MRRNIKNDKVLRAITIGLATMIAVTSSPLTVLASDAGEGADPNPVEGGNTPSEPENEPKGVAPMTITSADIIPVDKTQITAKSVSSEVSAMVNAAEGYNDAEKNGEVITNYNEGVQAVQNANDAMAAAQTFEQEVQSISDKLDNNLAPTPGGNGQGQITKAINLESNLENPVKDVYVGVKTDENGNVIDTSDLDNMVSEANDAIEQAEKDKKAAYKELKAAKEVASAADTAIDTAKGLKKTADSDTTAANEASATIADTRTTAEGKLDTIRQELENKVNQTTISGTVIDAGKASATALKTAVDELKTAQTALTDAQSAADEAQRNSSSYNRQQMINVATRAQNAANNAKSAAEVTELALKAAKDEEEKAKKAVSNAQTAYNKAIGDATEVLKGYKAEIDRINGLIDTANGSREEAKKAMKAANEAIDAALKLMHESDGTVTSANTAAFAYKTALESIKTANDKIQAVTGLNTGIDNAAKFQRTALMYIDGNGKNMYGLANELKDAKERYDNALAEKGTVEENKAKADAALAEINRIIDGIEGSYKGFFDMCKDNVDQDILDLKALLATGKTYKELTDAVETAGSELETASGDLVAKYMALKNIESTEKTAGDIKTEYETALGNQSTLDSNYNELDKELGKKEGTLSEKIRLQSEAFQALQLAYADATNQTGLYYETLKMKDKYEFDDAKQEFVPAENGVGYKLNSTYSGLLETAKEKTDDDWQFVNDKDETDKHSPDEYYGMWVTMANYSEEGENGEIKYVYRVKEDSPIGQPKVVESTTNPSDDWSTKYTKGVDENGNTVLIETSYDSYQKPVKETVNRYKTPEDKTDTKYLEIKPNKANQIKWSIVREKVANLCGVESDKVTINNGHNTATVTYKDKNGNEKKRTFKYTIDIQSNETNGNGYNYSYMLNLDEKDVETKKTVYTTKTQAFDYTRYTKQNLGGKPTADAIKAQEKIDEIDGKANVINYLTAKSNHASASQTKNELETELGTLNTELYGEGGTKEDPKEGSLAYRTNEALTAKTNNKSFTDDLESFVSDYNTKSGNKTDADTALSKANNYEEGAVAEARAAWTSIDNAEKTAKGFRTDLTGKVATLKTDIEDPKKNVDALTIYQGEDGKGGIFKRINDVRNELILVKTKLTNIKDTLNEKKKDLAKNEVDTIVTLKNGNTKDIETINNNLLKKVDKYKKFKPEKYGMLDYVESGIMNLEVLSVDLLDDSLAALISSTGTFLATQNENLTKISGQIAEIETILYGVHRTETDDEVGDLEEFEEVDGLWDIYNKAQAAADRAAKALANWRAPSSSSGEENDGDDDDSSSEEPGSGEGGAGVAVTGTIMASAGTIPVIPLPATSAGVAGARTGRRTSRSGVAGVRVDNGEGDGVANGEGDAAKNVVEPKAVATTNGKGKNAAGADKKFVKLENNEVPLADKPFEEGTNMNLLWLLAAATAAGAGAYGYGKHRKNVAANEESKKYKK